MAATSHPPGDDHVCKRQLEVGRHGWSARTPRHGRPTGNEDAGRPASQGPWENVLAGTRGWHRGITYRNLVPSGNLGCADFVLLIKLPSMASSSRCFLVLVCHVLSRLREDPGVKSVPTPRGQECAHAPRWTLRQDRLTTRLWAHACICTCVLACTWVYKAHIYTDKGAYTHAHTCTLRRVRKTHTCKRRGSTWVGTHCTHA